jgi:D-serine deaminase-like pyridoxal phosphate-dependent protein
MAKRALVEGLEDAEVIGHNEEHLVLRTPRAAEWPVGRMTLAWPWHICPTVAWHDQAWVFLRGQSAGVWPVAARGRQKATRPAG